MGLKDRKSDGLVFKEHPGSILYLQYVTQDNAPLFCVIFFVLLAFYMIVRFCWCNTCDTGSSCCIVLVFFCGAFVSDPILGDHIMLNLHLSVLLAQLQFKGSVMQTK